MIYRKNLIKYGILGFLVLLWVIASVFIYKRINLDKIELIFGYITLCFSLISALVGAYLNLWNAVKKNNFAKKIKALEYIESWEKMKKEVEIDKVENAIESCLSIQSVGERNAKLKELISTNNLKEDLESIFNFWERIYLAIEYNIADNYILKNSLGSHFKRHYQNFNYWLTDNYEQRNSETLACLNELNKQW